jgi:hypothetical protein
MIIDNKKVCNICNAIRDVDLFFNKRSASADGYHYTCSLCRKVRRKQLYKANPELYKNQVKNWKKNNIEKTMIKHIKKSARERGLEFNLELTDMVVPKICPVLGTKLEVNQDKARHNSPSVDRIDSSKGYIKGNIRIISWRANNVKGNSTIEELEAVLEYMKRELQVAVEI